VRELIQAKRKNVVNKWQFTSMQETTISSVLMEYVPRAALAKVGICVSRIRVSSTDVAVLVSLRAGHPLQPAHVSVHLSGIVRKKAVLPGGDTVLAFDRLKAATWFGSDSTLYSVIVSAVRGYVYCDRARAEGADRLLQTQKRVGADIVKQVLDDYALYAGLPTFRSPTEMLEKKSLRNNARFMNILRASTKGRVMPVGLEDVRDRYLVGMDVFALVKNHAFQLEVVHGVISEFTQEYIEVSVPQGASSCTLVCRYPNENGWNPELFAYEEDAQKALPALYNN